MSAFRLLGEPLAGSSFGVCNHTRVATRRGIDYAL